MSFGRHNLDTLSLSQLKVVPSVSELHACLSARELPVDSDVVAVHLPVPSFALPPQMAQRWNAALAQALSAEQTDLDLDLVQPASVFGCVTHREPVPQPPADPFYEPLHERLAAMRTQIVHHQMEVSACG